MGVELMAHAIGILVNGWHIILLNILQQLLIFVFIVMT